MSLPTIKMNQVPDAVLSVVQSGRTVCLIGPSGIGKTQCVSQIADQLNADLVVLNALTIDPASLNFPIVNPATKSVDWVPASIFLANGRRKLFFADEITHAPTMVQSLFYGITAERRIGYHNLPADCIIIAAHNRLSDRGVHNRVPVPLRRRWFELYVEPDLTSWCSWAITHDIEPVVIAFLRWREQYLYMDAEGDSPAPDPRAWEFLSDLLKQSPNMDPSIMHSLVCGKVGESAAIEFLAYLRLFAGLPNLDTILLNPKTEDTYTDPAVNYAIASGFARRANAANIGRIITYMERIADANGNPEHEYLVLCLKDSCARDKSIKSTREFIQFAVKYQEYLA